MANSYYSRIQTSSPYYAMTQVQAAINRLNSTALQWIARNCRGSIGREFPSQLYNKTLEQIKQLKDAGDEAAKKAWKLLHDGRFRK